MTFLIKYAAHLGRALRREVSVLSLGALVLLAGCGEDFGAPEDDSVLFSPLRVQSAAPRVVEDPDAPADDGIEEIQGIVLEFEKGMAADGAQAPPRMVDLESEFIQRGRYLDLIGIYQNMIKKNTMQPDAQGASARASATGPLELRLARAYLRLGQTHLAREILDKMILENPHSPMTWFLNAAYWLPEAADSEDAAARVVASWQKTLEIEPNFVGFEQPNAPSLKDQLAILRQRTPADKIATATAALHQKMNPSAVEKLAQNTPENTVEDAPVEEKLEEETKAQMALESKTPEQAPKPAVPPKSDEPAIEKTPEPAAKPQSTPILIAHANMALSQGKREEATKLFRQILERDADLFEAQFGLIRAGWTDRVQRNAQAEALRELAKRSDLTLHQQLELARFAYYSVEDRALAVKLWERVKKEDPELAKSVGVDALIEDARRPVDSD